MDLFSISGFCKHSYEEHGTHLSAELSSWKARGRSHALKLVGIPVLYIKSEASDTKKLFCLFSWLLSLVCNPRWRELLAEDISERLQNEMLRRIFEWKRQKVTGDWKFYVIKIFVIYIPYECEVAKWKGEETDRACSTHQWDKCPENTAFINAKWKKPVGKTTQRWNCDMKMNLAELPCEVVYWCNCLTVKAHWEPLWIP